MEISKDKTTGKYITWLSKDELINLERILFESKCAGRLGDVGENNFQILNKFLRENEG